MPKSCQKNLPVTNSSHVQWNSTNKLHRFSVMSPSLRFWVPTKTEIIPQMWFPICDGCSMLGSPQMDSWIPPMDCDPQNMRLRTYPRILIESSPIIYQLRDCQHFLKVQWWIFPYHQPTAALNTHTFLLVKSQSMGPINRCLRAPFTCLVQAQGLQCFGAVHAVQQGLAIENKKQQRRVIWIIQDQTI